jgi:[ribosomal protein S5]-alanine N-acetyltransferase
MSPDVVLQFEGGYLRPLKTADVYPGYVSGLNDPDVNRYLEVRFVTQTLQSVIDFVGTDEQSANAVLWGIWTAGSDHHVGTVRIHGIEHYHKTAHIGACLFDKSAWGKKLGSKAITSVTRWALDIVGLRWVEAGIYSENIASQKTFLAAGYEWIYDVLGKYILDGQPANVKVFAARKTDH